MDEYIAHDDICHLYIEDDLLVGDVSCSVAFVPKAFPQLELDQQFCFALYTACHAVMRSYRPLLADVELTYPQYLAMLAIWDHPDQSQTVGAIGQRLHMENGTLTPILKRLETAGFVSRVRDRDDERRVLVTVTEAGLALREQVASVPEALAACVGIDAAVGIRLRDELKELVVALERSESVGSPAHTVDQGTLYESRR